MPGQADQERAALGLFHPCQKLGFQCLKLLSVNHAADFQRRFWVSGRRGKPTEWWQSCGILYGWHLVARPIWVAPARACGRRGLRFLRIVMRLHIYVSTVQGTRYRYLEPVL